MIGYKKIIAIAFILMGMGITLKFIPESKSDVTPLQSSCTYNNVTYKSGDGFVAADGCNSCSCKDGEVICTLMACN